MVDVDIQTRRSVVPCLLGTSCSPLNDTSPKIKIFKNFNNKLWDPWDRGTPYTCDICDMVNPPLGETIMESKDLIEILQKNVPYS